MRIGRALSADPDPMVAKVLSWTLRALVGVDRAAVTAFLAEEAPRLPTPVRREVGNKLATGLKTGRRKPIR